MKDTLSITIEYDRYLSEKQLDYESLIREINWLLPVDAKIYDHVEPDWRDVVTTDTRPIGGGSDIDFFQFLISFLQQDGVTLAVIGALVTIINKVLDIIKDSEFTIERGDKKLTIKGSPKIDRKELIKALFPELSNSAENDAPSRLKVFPSATGLNIKTKARLQGLLHSEIANPENQPPYKIQSALIEVETHPLQFSNFVYEYYFNTSNLTSSVKFYIVPFNALTQEFVNYFDEGFVLFIRAEYGIFKGQLIVSDKDLNSIGYISNPFDTSGVRGKDFNETFFHILEGYSLDTDPDYSREYKKGIVTVSGYRYIVKNVEGENILEITIPVTKEMFRLG
jgi:hypothetical protein